MSKKFKGKPCVYCIEGISTKSGDHIFPRKLFLERRRGNLPKVACCKKCNDIKSRLEHYLLTVLPFGARHEDAIENLTAQVPGRLDQNINLHKKLYNQRRIEFVPNQQGILAPSVTIPVYTDKIERLFDFISRALIKFHFNIQLSNNDFITTSLDFDNIDSFLNGTHKNKIQNDLGNGTVVYTGIQATDNDKVTAWEFIIYGGLQITIEKPGIIVSFSGTQEVQNNVRRRRMFGV